NHLSKVPPHQLPGLTDPGHRELWSMLNPRLTAPAAAPHSPSNKFVMRVFSFCMTSSFRSGDEVRVCVCVCVCVFVNRHRLGSRGSLLSRILPPRGAISTPLLP